MYGPDNQLTPAVASDAGSVVFRPPVKTVGLDASFDLQFSGGNGTATGSPSPCSTRRSRPPPRSARRRRNSASAGLTGVAVMGTKLVKGYPSSNFVGISSAWALAAWPSRHPRC